MLFVVGDRGMSGLGILPELATALTPVVTNTVGQVAQDLGHGILSWLGDDGSPPPAPPPPPPKKGISIPLVLAVVGGAAGVGYVIFRRHKRRRGGHR